jgi:hypothetical protein
MPRGSRLIRLLGPGLLAAVACGHEHVQHADAGRASVDGGRPRVDAGTHDAAAAPSGSVDAGHEHTDADAGQARGLSLEQALRAYHGWQPRTAEPQAISAEIFSLCRLPSLAEQRFVDSEHGKDQLLLRDWLNPAAARGVAAGGVPRFELDSAIVKQKLRQAPDGSSEVAALGLMIKRAPGFDPAHGDWEYGYWEAASGLSSGPESQRHCGDCHAGSPTDHVYLDDRWRLPR